MGVDVFIGRQAELADIVALLEGERHVTLTGAAGVGKTSLALHVARALEHELPGGVHVLDLYDAPDDLSSLIEMLADVIGVRGQPNVSTLQSLADQLAPHPSLIVLDTCDRVVGAAGLLVDLLLRSVGALRILATSRQPLGLPDERRYLVDGLRAEDAVQLLTTLADGRLDGVDPAELCERLDHLPLAITLAATGPHPIADDVPVTASSDRRHSSMQAAYGWGHELCTPGERLLWARASAFSGLFDLEAAQHVCAGDGLTSDDVRGALLGLLGKSVVIRQERECGIRYRLSYTAREYGAARLEHLGEAGEMRRRHRDYFLDLSARADTGWRSRQLEWHQRLAVDRADLRTAIDYCYSTPGEHGKGLEMVVNLWFLWTCCGMQALGDDLLRRGLDLDRAPSPIRVNALLLHAWVLIERGDLDDAERILAECDAAGSGAAAYLSQLQAHLAVLRGDVGDSLRLIKDARVRHREAGNVVPGLLTTYIVMATALMLGGHHDEAASVLNEGRNLCHTCGDYWTLTRLDLLLAQAQHLAGDSAATASTRDSLHIARLLDDSISLIEGLEMSVVIAETEEEDELATILLGASDAASKQVEVPPCRRSPVLSTMLRTSELRLRGRVNRAKFHQLIELGGSTSLPAAVEHALQGTSP
ncbi:ATP-binding protein [Nonomuraea basaltis]|uniref:ATP-binding protein n=1 Tax=Nonomuraea basaltis TaxID=2495887 RepID=UPI00110C4157|nr:tetratricopeptide repeat protein [Nonomuraea basaltis]TMR97669.1 tetratricopeptide repeat protein [Nonomuraea basaltis]